MNMFSVRILRRELVWVGTVFSEPAIVHLYNTNYK